MSAPEAPSASSKDTNPVVLIKQLRQSYAPTVRCIGSASREIVNDPFPTRQREGANTQVDSPFFSLSIRSQQLPDALVTRALQIEGVDWPEDQEHEDRTGKVGL